MFRPERAMPTVAGNIYPDYPRNERYWGCQCLDIKDSKAPFSVSFSMIEHT